MEREQRLLETTTLYVGNLSFYTTEEQVFDLFSKVGEIKRIIMGLDRIKKTPCGFCFVEYFTREDAEKSVQFLCDTKLDERTIRVDYDIGFKEGRQYGRGRSGGQVRDEHRVDYDPGRGGYGKSNAGSMSGHEMWGNHEPDRGGGHGPTSMLPPSFHMNQHHQPPPPFGPGGHPPPHYGPGARHHPPYPPPPQHFHEGSHHHGPPPHYMHRRGGGRGHRGRGPRGGGGGPPPHGGGIPPRYFNGGGGGMPVGGNGVPPLYEPHPPSFGGKRFRDDMPQFGGPSEMNMPKRHRPEVDDMQNQN